MKRPDELQKAFHRAARHAYEAERDLAWCPYPYVKKGHEQALARCERVVLQAAREAWITLAGAQALIGVVLDAQTLARWSVKKPEDAPVYWHQVEGLERAIDRTWRRARRGSAWIKRQRWV